MADCRRSACTRAQGAVAQLTRRAGLLCRALALASALTGVSRRYAVLRYVRPRLSVRRLPDRPSRRCPAGKRLQQRRRMGRQLANLGHHRCRRFLGQAGAFDVACEGCTAQLDANHCAQFDAGYCVHLQIVGSALLVFSLFMTSLCTKLWQLVLAQGVGIGVRRLAIASAC